MEPTPVRFSRLARSGPYRWRGLVLEGSWGPSAGPARIAVTQPDLVRVERLDGAPVHEGRQGSLSSGAPLTADGRPSAYVPPPAPPPALDGDGLVVSLRRPWLEGPSVPFWQDYRFVAVLDPYELSHGVDVLSVRAVDHGGRAAWEALLRPTGAYEPRCCCCALLRSSESDVEAGLDPLPSYADAHRVRLDVATGVCVSAREVGGPQDGQGHDLAVLHVTA